MQQNQDTALVTELLARTESNILDFKRDQYRLDSDNQKSDFVRDIISMANTPRDETAYIIIGVVEENGRVVKTVGADRHLDPAAFQDLANGRTDHAIDFSYRAVPFGALELGLFEIPVDRNIPVMARANFHRIRAGTVYIRRNAQNAVADASEIGRIYDWRRTALPAPTTTETSTDTWELFYRACSGFEEGRIYVAVIGEDPVPTKEYCQMFATVGWQIVVDFDRNTDENGIFLHTKEHLEKRRSLRLTALDAPLGVVSRSACLWIAADGLASRPTTTKGNTFREWNRNVAGPMGQAMTSVARVTEPLPVTAIIMGGSSDVVRVVCERLDEAFGDRLDFVFANDTYSRYSDLIGQFEGTAVSISFPAICSGLHTLSSDQASLEDVDFPANDGGFITVPPGVARWLEEELELVHQNVGMHVTDLNLELEHFLRGNQVTWGGLSLNVDVERRVMPRLQQLVTDCLESRSARRLNLIHWPGGGGTTAARRVAWNLHRRFPTVLVTRVVPDALIDRIRFLFETSRLPVLVIVEDSVTRSDDLDRVYDRLRSNNISALLLRVRREASVRQWSESVYLGGLLDNQEAVAFANKLTSAVPDRASDLERLMRDTAGTVRTPFYFGLVAFGKDFLGLEPYVNERLQGASDNILSLCKTSAMLYHFGQQQTPIQLFASIFALPRTKLMSLPSILPPLLQELFVQDGGPSFRPAHELIANEMLEQLLTIGAADKRNWRWGLTNCTMQMIELAAIHHDHVGGEIANLVGSVLIERGIRETPAGLREDQFSNLVNDIPSTEGKRAVLEKLTETFPNEAHFWAHLGRLYTRVTQEHPAAHQSHGKSIEISPQDPVLHHMAGMAFRGELEEILEGIARNGSLLEEESKIQQLAMDGLDRFRDSRFLEPVSEHSYISAIELIARVISMMGRSKGYDGRPEGFLTAPGEGWYRELFDKAETLVSDLDLVRRGEEPSSYRRRAEASLDQAYGDFGKAIEGWTNLLEGSESYRPPLRRNIINAYLSREGRDWNNLSARTLHRILELSQQNLDEEPDSDQNLRTWFRAVRATDALPLNAIAERLAYKRVQNPTVDTLYYLYIVQFLQAVTGGVGRASRDAERTIRECADRAAGLPYRTRSYEWLAEGVGIKSLLNVKTLGEWDPNMQFWSETKRLRRVNGTIRSIRGPAAGEIELRDGLKAFFVPSRGLVEGGYLRNRDEGRQVDFYVAFSYDGLRAWSVGNV